MSKKVEKIKKNIISLDVGSGSLKIVVGDFTKDMLNIKEAIYVPVPEEVFINGELENVDKLAQLLKQTLKHHKIKAKNCFCCFDSNQVIAREVTIPSPNKDNLQEMAKFEVEQYLPVEMSNYSVQSIIMKELEINDKPYAEMLVTAFPFKIIERLHSFISQSGLKPLVLDTKSNSFAKLVEFQEKINGNDYHKEGTTAFIDFGNETISVTIFSKGKYRFHRIIKMGGRHLDLSISKQMDLPLDEAHGKKLQINNINYTVDEDSIEGKINNIVKTSMSYWFDEIAKIFRYYASKSPSNREIEYIYIYGGSSKISGMSDLVQSYFKIPVSKIRKISSVSIEDDIEMSMSEALNAFGTMYRR